MTKEVLNHFRDVYFEKYEAQYPVTWGKDMATVKRLLKTYDADTLKSLIDGYFKLTDPFVVNAGHPLGLLQSQIPKVVSRQSKERTETISGCEEDAELIEKARKNVSENDGEF